MEKAILVTYDLRSAHHEEKGKICEDRALKKLNDHLEAGWRVKTISQLSGTAHAFATGVVILEKE